MNEKELRPTPGLVEVRAAAADRRAIGGYAAKFNTLSSDLGGFVEQVAPTFFNRSRGKDWPGIDGNGVIARFDHNPIMILGRTSSGTLRLAIDDIGLLYDVDVPESRADVYELVQRGDVRQSSFAFITIDDTWDKTESNYPLRTLISGTLVDVSPVANPAYPDATVALSSLARHFDAPVEEIRALAASKELHRLFVRTDGPPLPPTPESVKRALAETQAKDLLDEL